MIKTANAQTIAEAAEILKTGGLVGMPTETVYGLAANALDGQAVARIFQAKGRPAFNPLIIHVPNAAAAETYVEFNEWAFSAAAAFWPGPLTLVLTRSERIPDVVTAGGPTVGIRWPSHPFMQAVIRECGFPLAAPSANPSDRLSPTCAEHCAQGLGERIPLIVDGGQCAVGIESTVVDVTGPFPRILRPGVITAAQYLWRETPWGRADT
jgi:L-threonylcarbamoyladenylate synthase